MGYYGNKDQGGFADNARPKPIRKKAVKKIRKTKSKTTTPTTVYMDRNYTSTKSSRYTARTKLNGATITVTHKTKHICETAVTDLLDAFGYTPKWTDGEKTYNF